MRLEDIEGQSDIIRLYTQPYDLIHISMGDIQRFSFDGQSITEEEYRRLERLAEVLGIERPHALSNWSVKVVPSPYGIPLANSEDEIQLD